MKYSIEELCNMSIKELMALKQTIDIKSQQDIYDLDTIDFIIDQKLHYEKSEKENTRRRKYEK